MDELSESDINALLNRAATRYSKVIDKMRTRRLLINREMSDDNATGTLLPPPFDKTSLAIKSMLGQPVQAAQHYAARISSNRPDIAVIPVSHRSKVSDRVSDQAGEQERLAAMLWEEAGGRKEQWNIGWAMAVGGVGYYLTLPRDAAFGLPDRAYYNVDDDEAIRQMVADGKINAVPVERGGKLVYAEAGDVWAARRKDAAQNRVWNGTSLFTLRAFSRDQVLCERDADGLKWAAIIEEISSTDIKAGSELARAAAKTDGIDPAAHETYGLLYDGRRIIGGIAQGSPSGTEPDRAFTLIRFFTRTEQIILVTASGNYRSGKVVYRGKHGATRMGDAVCPVVEVPFTRTDVTTPGMEFSTPLEQVFSLVPLINQLLTLHSNASAYNLLPRWVIELKDGSLLRGDDGEPVVVSSQQTPGLDPQQAAAYPGTLKQLTIKTDESLQLLGMYMKELENAMPPAAAMGASGTSEAAWHAHQMIQQAQAIFKQPVDNHAAAVRQIIQMWNGWMRQLDTPVYFASAPGHRQSGRQIRGLIEFDPKDLTDSIYVDQGLDTAEESVVRIQIGMQLRQAGAIDDESFFADYMKIPDARQAVIDMYVQQVVSHVMGAIPAPPGSVIATVADAVRGRLTYQLLQQSPNFAIASAEQNVQQAQMAALPQGGQAPNTAPMGGQSTGQGGPHGAHPNVADAAGVSMPGMGMAPTLPQQLGAKAPVAPGIG